jgi:FAD/FMN-containing dehydrogenase
MSEPSPSDGRDSQLPPRTPTRRRRAVVLLVLSLLLVAAFALSRPLVFLTRTALRDVDERPPLPPGQLDDASRLNATPVAEVFDVPSAPAAAEQALATLLDRARHEKRPVSIAGARHSMGGQTLAAGGIVVNMLPLNHLELDDRRNLLHAGAGATWTQIIPWLDARGRSVAVMQSNNSFSVGGSISVNCHGWQHNHAPIASTVESFRLMQADGQVVRCSRDEQAELFSLVLGGYGLFGIILDVELRVVPNERYRIERHVIPTDQYVRRFHELADGDPSVAMVYGRLCVMPDRLCDEAVLNLFYRDPADDGSVPPLSAQGLADIRRTIFRGSAESDYGKELRWQAETQLQAHLTGRNFSRNQLLNEGVELFQNRSSDTTDILHEYFVPAAGITPFLAAVKQSVPRHGANLLNVTVRNVFTDDDAFLRYADRDLFAFVMLYNQPRTDAAEVAMQRLTQDLIDAALAEGGRYYLPYRLHATPGQFARAYPQAQEFFAAKRRYDPESLFQNAFWKRYGATP